MNVWKKRYLIVIIALFLCGCGTNEFTKIDKQFGTEYKGVVQFLESDKETEVSKDLAQMRKTES